MFCTQCGAKAENAAKFCAVCGAALGTAAPARTAALSTAPVRSNPKSPAAALMLSLLFPGLGWAYGGNIKQGILQFLGVVAALYLFWPLAVFVYLFGAIAAYVVVFRANAQPT